MGAHVYTQYIFKYFACQVSFIKTAIEFFPKNCTNWDRCQIVQGLYGEGSGFELFFL